MTRALVPAVFGLLGLGLVACGGEDDGRPSGARTVAPAVDECEAASAQYEFSDIVRFENVGNEVSPASRSCEEPWATCTFYFNYDEARTVIDQDGDGIGQAPTEPCLSPPCPAPKPLECLSLQPAVTDPDRVGGVPTAIPTPGGARCGTSNGAIRVKALNVGQCFGADGRLGWGAGLDLTFPAYLDAGDAEGIGFWVKRASPTSDVTGILSVVDAASNGIDVTAGHPEPHCGCMPDGNGKYHCSKDPSKDTTKDPSTGMPYVYPDEVKCDPFGAAFTVTDDWSFIALRFADMTQKGFGFPLPGLDTSGIQRLQFLVNHGSTDFYIDDITLFRAK